MKPRIGLFCYLVAPVDVATAMGGLWTNSSPSPADSGNDESVSVPPVKQNGPVAQRPLPSIAAGWGESEGFMPSPDWQNFRVPETGAPLWPAPVGGRRATRPFPQDESRPFRPSGSSLWPVTQPNGLGFRVLPFPGGGWRGAMRVGGPGALPGACRAERRPFPNLSATRGHRTGRNG